MKLDQLDGGPPSFEVYVLLIDYRMELGAFTLGSILYNMNHLKYHLCFFTTFYFINQFILNAIFLIFCTHIYNAIYFDTITIFLGFHTKFYSINTQISLPLVVEWFENAFKKKQIVIISFKMLSWHVHVIQDATKLSKKTT